MIFVIKLNDSKNGLSSTNNEYKNNAIYIHKILNKNNINITDFDYTPDFGIMENDWIDKYHWNLDFYNKWCYWIINKISQLLLYNNLLTNTNNKLLIISDSTLDYKDNNINRKNIFKNILIEYNIFANVIAKGGGAFSSKYKSNNFYNMINKKNILKKKYCGILIIGGINDTFNNKKSIKNGINNFIHLINKYKIINK